jgi:hypothetical protein
MYIQLKAALTGRLTYAQTEQAKARTEAMKAERKRTIDSEKAEAMASPRLDGLESRKAQAKARIQQVVEWLKIVRKLYAQDPKGMAKALAQAFKDLKAAVKSYREAGGQEMAMSGDLAGAALANNRSPDRTAGAEAPKEAAAQDSPPPSGEEANRASKGAEAASEADLSRSSEGPDEPGRAGLYEAVVAEVRKALGEDSLDFVKQVRGLVIEITKLLDAAKGQAAIRSKDKDTDKAMEEVDKTLKDLHEELDTMEQDIHREVPTAGMRLSIAA